MANARRTEQDVQNEKSNRVMNGIALWCSFYRANPHRFCEDYLNIKLHFFQRMFWRIRSEIRWRQLRRRVRHERKLRMKKTREHNAES